MKNKFKLLVILGLTLFMFSALFGAPSVIKADATSTVEEVSNYSQMVSAINDDNIEEVVITNAISLSNDAEIDGKNKIFRAKVTGVNEQGIVQSGSNITLFKNSSYKVTLKNMKILGGSNTAITNDGFMTLENVSISRSGGADITAGAVRNNGTLIMKNCSVVRNVAKNGGGIVNAGGLLVLDGCSLTENRSLGTSGGGGAIEVKSSTGILVANNTVFANNTSSEIGGAINIYTATVYLINSTVVGNATTRPASYGGGIGVNNGKLYGVNCIFTDNYAFNGSLNKAPLESDLASYSNSSTNIFLYNSIYKTVANATISKESANNIKLDNLSSVEGVFTSYQTSGILSGDGSSKTEVFQKPIVTSLSDGRLYAPVNSDCEIVKNGVKTYFDYSNLYSGSKTVGISLSSAIVRA